MRTIAANTLVDIFDEWIAEIEAGIKRAQHLGTVGYNDDGKSEIVPTYFAFNVTSWEETGERNDEGHPFVRAKSMSVQLLPLFLEGPTRMMKTLGPEDSIDLYSKLRTSQLRDDVLNMYTISASLKTTDADMGREIAFAPGWLENQSVWMHMSYKFYLELLRSGQFATFYEEATNGGMLPFMDPELYGRSLTECSSFIASSSFEDPAIRGKGFLPRLSGSTAEFLSMWVLMFVGPEPFFFESSRLGLSTCTGAPQMAVSGNYRRCSFRVFQTVWSH